MNIKNVYGTLGTHPHFYIVMRPSYLRLMGRLGRMGRIISWSEVYAGCLLI